MGKKPVIIGRINRHCDLCGKLAECHVIQTKSGSVIVCSACRKKKYKGVE